MTTYRRNFIAGASYFFTVNLAERRLRLLTDNIELLRAAFRDTRRRHPFAIDAIAVLPDHLHAIWTLPGGDADFASRWQLIKAGFSRGLPHGRWTSPAWSASSAGHSIEWLSSRLTFLGMWVGGRSRSRLILFV
jgi:REP-associated tyrosine transposase